MERGEHLTIDGRPCKCIGEFTVALVEFENGTREAIVKGEDELLMMEGIMRAAKGFQLGLDLAEILRR